MKKIIVLTVSTLAYFAGNTHLESMDQPSHKQENQRSCIQHDPSATAALLMLSNAECSAEQILTLLDQNADINTTTTARMTPLHFAAQNGRDDLVRLFLERGAHPVSQNECGMTPLHCAAYAGRISTIRLFLDRGIPPDNRAWLFSPLHFAICYHQLAAARLLTQRGANIHALSPSGFEPRDFWRGRPAQRFFMKLPLLNQRLFSAIRRGDWHESMRLLNRGAQINAQDRNGNTPLHCAAQQGLPIGRLIMRGADPTARNIHGDTPVHNSAGLNALAFMVAIAKREPQDHH